MVQTLHQLLPCETRENCRLATNHQLLVCSLSTWSYKVCFQIFMTILFLIIKKSIEQKVQIADLITSEKRCHQGFSFIHSRCCLFLMQVNDVKFFVSLSVGGFGNFGTSTTGFHELFPGIRSRVCTLNYHFYIPFYRDLVLSWGMISPKRSSIAHSLNKSNNKTAVCNADGYTSNAVSL